MNDGPIAGLMSVMVLFGPVIILKSINKIKTLLSDKAGKRDKENTHCNCIIIRRDHNGKS